MAVEAASGQRRASRPERLADDCAAERRTGTMPLLPHTSASWASGLGGNQCDATKADSGFRRHLFLLFRPVCETCGMSVSYETRRPHIPPGPTTVLTRHRATLSRLAKILALVLVAALLALLSLRLLLVPLLLYIHPAWYTYFYQIGVFGLVPLRTYRSFSTPSPLTINPRWDTNVCDFENDNGGLVLLDAHGGHVGDEGPLILDLKGNLVWTWTDHVFGQRAMNTKVQKYKGEDYITFWAGGPHGGGGKGKFYMLDNAYILKHTIEAVGDRFFGDQHEFVITEDDTALIIIFDDIHVDLSNTNMTDIEDSFITDAVFQEIDIQNNNLLFQWRASDHFDATYLKQSDLRHRVSLTDTDYTSSTAPYDVFHMNSIHKDSRGNYLVSFRHMSEVLCVSGNSGRILWGFGGNHSDFSDLSGGAASDFRWQHDVRWVDEEKGILSLFDNGVARGHIDAPYSTGRLIHLDVPNRTAKLLHTYSSLEHTRSGSQGSLQYIPSASPDTTDDNNESVHPNATVFIGWGSSALYSLFDADTSELLCETHWAASRYTYYEFAKSYRTTRAPRDWKARPSNWSPHAVATRSGKVYVSWNGATEVQTWVLKGKAWADDADWEEVQTVARNGLFESVLEFASSAKNYHRYRVTALSGTKEVLRHSNEFYRPMSVPGIIFWTLFVGAAVGAASTSGFWYIMRSRKMTAVELRERWKRAVVEEAPVWARERAGEVPGLLRRSAQVAGRGLWRAPEYARRIWELAVLVVKRKRRAGWRGMYRQVDAEDWGG